MSTTETPPPPTPVERRCPRCGARLSADQEWCLECGTAVGTEIAGPRGARATLGLIGGLVAIALIAVILAIVELAGDAERVTSVPQTPTPAPATPAPTTSPEIPPGEEGGTGATPSPSATPGATVAPTDLAEWPQGRTAWTVILNSSGTEEDAQRLGGELAGKGIPNVGVLDSNDFQSLGPDSFIVFSGQYDDRDAATQALNQIRAQAGGGSVRRIVPN